MKFGSFLFFLLFAQHIFGQVDSVSRVELERDFLKQLSERDSVSEGVVRMSGDPRIEQLLRLYMSVSQRDSSFQGFRIQLLSRGAYGVDMEALQQFIEEFSLEFPDIPIYLQYIDPDFKIRIGNFRSRLESIPTLKRVVRKYPNCYPVKTIIHFRDLNSKQKQEENEESLAIAL